MGSYMIWTNNKCRVATYQESLDILLDSVRLKMHEIKSMHRRLFRELIYDIIVKQGITEYVNDVLAYKYSPNDYAYVMRLIETHKYNKLMCFCNIPVPISVKYKTTMARKRIPEQLRGYFKRVKRHKIIGMRNIGLQTKINKKKMLRELTYHPKYMSGKLSTSDIDLEEFLDSYTTL